MTNDECQMTKEARMTKTEACFGSQGFLLRLVIRASSFIRHLAFVIRHFRTPADDCHHRNHPPSFACSTPHFPRRLPRAGYVSDDGRGSQPIARRCGPAPERLLAFPCSPSNPRGLDRLFAA